MANEQFTKEHEWVRMDGDVAVVGISEYAQEQLGDIVFVDLPQVGATLEKGSEAAVIESVKAASEVYAPAAGEVIEVNEALADEPGKVNASALGDGWLFKIRCAAAAAPQGLMDAAAYKTYVEGLD
jgi:glycine cleavage system H protein